VVGVGEGEGGAEEPEGPFLGQGPGVGEDDRDGRVADLDGGEQLGDEAGAGVFELEDVGVAVLDDHRSARQAGEVGELVGEAAVDERAGEISQALALDRGDELGVEADAVVACRQRLSAGGGLLAGEPVGVAFPGVDQDLELGVSGGAAGGHPDAGPGLAGGARTLPEDPVGRAGQHDSASRLSW
jgi:hypothetical protein